MRKLGKLYDKYPAAAFAAGFLLQITLLPGVPYSPDPTVMPVTGPFRDGNGKVIGTVTAWGSRMYVRNLNGELIATIQRNAEGGQTMYDPHGKVIDQIK